MAPRAEDSSSAAEETVEESVRRKPVLGKDTDATTSSESEEDEKDWIKVVDADLDWIEGYPDAFRQGCKNLSFWRFIYLVFNHSKM